MNLSHAVAPSAHRNFKPQEDTRLSTSPKAVFEELFKLLEEYGPIWYTEELHTRARIALSRFQ